MGRQEQPLDPGQGPLARFAYDLRELRRRAGSPSYRELASRTHYSASTLAAAADGRRLPSAAVLAAFTTACGGDPEEWERRRLETHTLLTEPAAVPAPAPVPAPVPDSPAGAPPPAPPARRRRWWSRLHGAGCSALRRPVGVLAAVAAVVAYGVLVPGDSMQRVGAGVPDDTRWLRADAGIPRPYRSLIVQAGTGCDYPGISPALVAAMLEAESGFDPLLSDPANDEYGIARWTPRVLRHYLPPERQGAVPVPPFGPEDSIPALGRMLCAIAPELEGVPGDPALNFAAAFRTATWVVQRQDAAALLRIRPYLDRVHANLQRYRPPARG